MSQWLSESTNLASALSHAGESACDRRLRAIDVALALAALLLLALPLAAARALGTLHGVSMAGRHGSHFKLLSLALPDHALGRIFGALGAAGWPVLVNILRGDMAWVGPAPRPGKVDPAHPRFLVRPGVTSLWDIRCRTAVDFGTEDAATLEYLSHRGPRHDLGLLARAVFVRLFAVKRPAAAGRVRICDVEFDNVNMDEALARIESMLDCQEAHQVSFVNPACVNIAAGDRGYRRSLARAGFVLPDGIGTKIAGDMLGTPIKQNVNGTDLFPRLCDRLDARGTRLFLLGGQPGVPERVAEVIRTRWPRIQIVGMRDGFFGTAEEGDVAAQVRDSGADFLLVARGVPMQDVFIDRYLHHFGTRVAMGVGGLFDFVSGRIDRAPRWMRDIGMEWMYRLIQEPARMWKRYLVGNFTFLARVALQRLRLRHPINDTQPLPDGTVAPAGSTVAVLMATHTSAQDVPGHEGLPAALLPMGASTFIERAVTQLVQCGVRDIHVVACARPDLLRRALGDGARWGVNLVWHLAKDEHQALQALPLVARGDWRHLIVGHADQWISASALARLAEDSVFVERADQDLGSKWTGWASVHPATLTSVDRKAVLEPMLRVCVGTRLALDESAWASATSAAMLLRAQVLACANLDGGVLPRTWIRTPWGAMSPQARVAPGAILTGPVLLGPGCLVEAGATVGPNAVLAADVIVSANTTVESSLVLPATYMGSGLSLRDALVQGSTVQHVSLGVCIRLPEADGLLFSMRRKRAGWPRLGRVLAVGALAALAPLTGLVALARRVHGQAPLWSRTAMRVSQGGASAPRTLRIVPAGLAPLSHLAAQFGPLLDLASGRRQWLGVRPRQASEWYALHPDWQAQLSGAPVGVLHVPRWIDDPASAIESAAAADLYLLAQRGSRARMRLTLEALRGLATPEPVKSQAAGAPSAHEMA